ncbi:hypothetical protein PBI_CANTARE_101 [Brevibacterium phage Cantare]|uniref:Uncharacterized protein n=1 Tax=Brevibacterium phage Cantare TaxID=2338395 RepID=A0A3G3LYX1_9CAUD|nr:hypothetical protein PQD70_gp101 [Brevibacterium phage Cantare]AYQ99321.1 hypothetical protein PBI_CANTARE_101 [Brevibacterium phage Cantare]
MPPEDTWGIGSNITSDAMGTMSRALRGAYQGVDYNDPNNPVAGAMANIQKQMNNIGRSIANAQNGVYAKGGILGQTITMGGNANSVVARGNQIEERMTMEKLEKQMKDDRLATSSHVRNRILNSMSLQKHPETTLVHTVTMYKDPSHKWNDIFYLVVNGGHRMAKWDVDGSVMTVLDEEMCTLPARSVGMKKTVRIDAEPGAIEYECGVMNWSKFVQYFAKAFTYSSLPTLNHTFASNEFAEGSTDEVVFFDTFPTLDSGEEVFVLSQDVLGKTKLAVLDVFDADERRDSIISVRKYKESGRMFISVYQEELRAYSQDVYDMTEVVLRNLGMREFKRNEMTSFESHVTDMEAVHVTEMILNLIVGFDKGRKNYATEFSYVVYRNKIRK